MECFNDVTSYHIGIYDRVKFPEDQLGTQLWLPFFQFIFKIKMAA